MSGLSVHFDLLKKEHQTLVSKYNDLLRTSAQNQNCLAVQLFHFVTELYKKELLSDITIVVGTQAYPSHRFLLGARTDYWNDLSTISKIEITDVPADIFEVIFHWLYTDRLSQDIRDSDLLKVAEQAYKYKFTGLLDTCELWLKSRLDVENCVEIFEFAENAKQTDLSEQCSTLVAARWKEFRRENFVKLSANLLYRLLKGNSDNVLRSIIQLGREDVLFLFFIDNESKLSFLLNDRTSEMCALEETLSIQMSGIADQLVQHGADVNLVYENGDSILMRLIEKGNTEGLRFLCRNNVKLNGIQNASLNITPLQQLCSCPLSMEIIDWLRATISKFEINVVPEALDPDISRSPLSLACLNEDEHSLQLVQILLSNSAKPNLLDSDGLFPLYHAIFINKKRDLAEELVKSGADVNAKINGEPLFHLLVAEPDSFKFLLKQKPDLSLVNTQGSPILHHAIHSFEANQKVSVELVSSLAEAGADITSCDAEQRTALHLAVETDRKIVEVLRPMLKEFPWETQSKSGKTVLQLALEKKDLETAQFLINSGAPVNKNNGKSLLIETLEQGYDDGAVFLLVNRADYNVKDTENRSPLELALTNGLIGTVRSLCGSGVNLNERSQNGYCIVEKALVNDHMDCVSLLIGYGCDLQSWTECEDGEQTLLHHLMDQGNEKAAVFLIENDIDINAKKQFKNEADDDGQTPLHMAVAWGLAGVVKSLIAHGADLNSQDKDERTACHIAVRENNTEALELLLAAPDVSFISTRDKKGQTPLSLAIGRKDHKSAVAIVSRQPHAALQTNGNGENLLHVAVRSNDLESVLFLLGTHTDPTRTTQDQSRRTALHLSAAIDNELIMRNLILAGCVVDARSSDGSTSLHEAIRARKPNLVLILLENNARTDILDERGECAILCAVRSGSLLCVKALFEHNCLSGPVINKQEQSVLHICAGLSSDRVEKGARAEEICEVLLKHEERYMTEKELGMFVDAKDKNGNTALLTGFMQGNAGVCRTLLKRGATMAAKNNDGVTLFTYETPTKQLLFGLLDSLEKEPRWSDGDFCDCGVKFSITQRKHHCRHCGRVVCAPCSSISMPIVKFGEEKKVRVCSMCSIVLTEGGPRL